MMDYLAKIESLQEENLHPSDAFTAKIMIMVQNKLLEDRDNERFEDWTYEKIVSKCNLHGAFYAEEEQRKRLRDLKKERVTRQQLLNSISLGGEIK